MYNPKSFVISLLVLFSINSINAQIDPNLTFESLLNLGTYVVEGEVRKGGAFKDELGMIFTEYKILLTKDFKGNVNGGALTFISAGGELDDAGLYVCPSLHPNDGAKGIFVLEAFGDINQGRKNIHPVAATQSFFALSEADGTLDLGMWGKKKAGDVYSSIETHYGRQMRLFKPQKRERSPMAVPTISNITPLTTQAGRGQEITITGNNFEAAQGDGGVFFRNVNAGSSTINIEGITYTQWTNTQIKVIVPMNAGHGSIIVRNDSGMSSTPSAQQIAVTYNVINSNAGMELRLVDFAGDGDKGYRFAFSTNTMDGGVDITAVGGAVAAVQRAATTWHGGTNKFAIYVGINCATTTIQVPSADNVHIVSFDNDNWDLDVEAGSSVLGVMYLNYWRCGASEFEIRSMDMILRRDGNPNGFGGSVNWEYGPNAPSGSESDFESVVLHEFGHARLLGHNRVANAVMQPFILNGTAKRNLTSSEVSGGTYIQNQSKAYNPPITGCAGLNFPRQYGDYDPMHDCQLVMALDLIHFHGKALEEGNLLKWETANEINHKNIELQCNSKAGGFQTIATYAGDGDKKHRDYQFTHITDQLLTGYRLKINDYNGDHNVSDVIYIERKRKDDIELVQMGDKLEISGTNLTHELIKVQLCSIDGRMLPVNGSLEVVSDGKAYFTLPTNYSGVKLLLIQIGEKRKVFKMLGL